MDVRFKRSLFVLVPAAVVAAVVLVGMIFATMPAQFIMSRFELPEKIRIGHLAGTVWSGRATEVVYQDRLGPFAAKDTKMNLAWEWCPGHGLMAMCVQIESPLVKGEGTFKRALFGGGFKLSDTRLQVLIPSYPVALGRLKSNVKGGGEIHFERLAIDPKDARLLTELRANGSVRGLQASGFELGDYLWHASLVEDVGEDVKEGSALMSDFNGGNDQFTLVGQAFLNLNDRSYRYTADLKTEDPGLLQLLKGRAKKSAENTLTFSGDGKLSR